MNTTTYIHEGAVEELEIPYREERQISIISEGRIEEIVLE